MLVTVQNVKTFQSGVIEFRGIPVSRPDGSVQIPIDPNSDPVRHITYRSGPENLVPEPTLWTIADRISLSMWTGETDGYRWWRE
jgi:hypothetical protein